MNYEHDLYTILKYANKFDMAYNMTHKQLITEAVLLETASPKQLLEQFYKEIQYDIKYFYEKNNKKDKDKKKMDKDKIIKMQQQQLQALKQRILQYEKAMRPPTFSQQLQSTAKSIIQSILRAKTVSRLIIIAKQLFSKYILSHTIIIKSLLIKLGVSAKFATYIYLGANTVLGIGISVLLSVVGGYLFAILWKILMKIIKGIFYMLKQFINWLKGQKKSPETEKKVKQKVEKFNRIVNAATNVIKSKAKNPKLKKKIDEKQKKLKVKFQQIKR